MYFKIKSKYINSQKPFILTFNIGIHSVHCAHHWLRYGLIDDKEPNKSNRKLIIISYNTFRPQDRE